MPGIVDEEVVWACTTCGACMQECPVDIEHVDTIVDLRRNLVMAESRFPAEAGALLRNLENQRTRGACRRHSAPPGRRVSTSDRGRRRARVPVLGRVRRRVRRPGRDISQAVAQLLQRAGVSFAILGPRELCTGDPARRIGNEYLFQTLAEQNVETLNAAGVTKVVANCPHCFNTLRNEYPDYGGHFEVIHHTQLFAHLVPRGACGPTEQVATLLAYHDPCYLGRHNGLPRAARGASVPGVGRSRCRATGSARCAAAPAGPGCGWRSGSASGSTRSAPTRPPPPAPTPSGSPAPTA